MRSKTYADARSHAHKQFVDSANQATTEQVGLICIGFAIMDLADAIRYASEQRTGGRN